MVAICVLAAGHEEVLAPAVASCVLAAGHEELLAPEVGSCSSESASVVVDEEAG